MTSTRQEVYTALDSERDYQDSRGVATDGHRHVHGFEEYLLYIDDYLTEAKHTASRVWGAEARPKVMEIIRKVTALGVACMEDNGAIQRAGFEREAGPGTVRIFDERTATEWERVSTAKRLLESLPEGYLGSTRHESSHGTVHMEDVRESVIKSLSFRMNKLVPGSAP